MTPSVVAEKAEAIEKPAPACAPGVQGRTYAIINYGCQMNEHDCELMEGLLSQRGWRRAPESDGDFADLVVLNTCCVREGAENRAMARLMSLRSTKKARREAVIALCGCVAQEQGGKLLDTYDHLDLVIGTRDYVNLPDLVERRLAGAERACAISDIDKPFSVNVAPIRTARLKAFANIMYGCNNSCTFCIVPKTRGEEYSRPIADVVAEVRQRVEEGAREIMLLGQNVNSYRDPNGRDFADLLYAINDIAGLWRIRYMTSNPKDFRDRHLRALAECDKVCEHLHLPLQSGSSSTLRRMRRSYNRERYLRQVEMFREMNPEHSLTTDVIVGFCGETDEEFEETMSLVEAVQFDAAFMFKYSPRPGTVSADTMKDDVAGAVKHERLSRLIKRQEEISAAKNVAMVGRIFEVLVEGPARRGEGNLMGRTRTDKVIVFKGDAALTGGLSRVRVTEAFSHTLFGEWVS